MKVAVALAVALAAAGAHAEDPRLAVLDATGLKGGEQKKLTASLRLGTTGALTDPRITLVDEKAQQKALKRVRPCKQGATQCALDAAKAIGATLVVAGEVAKAGKGQQLTVWMLDVASGAVLAMEAQPGKKVKDVLGGAQGLAARVVAAGLKAREPRKPPPPKAPPPPPPPKVVDNFSRTFGAQLVASAGTVDGKVTLNARGLSFEPTSTSGAQAWEEVPLLEIARIEKFNHMMMLPTGVELITTTGRSVKLVFLDDRDRIIQLIQSRIDILKDAGKPKAPAAVDAGAPNVDAGG